MSWLPKDRTAENVSLLGPKGSEPIADRMDWPGRN
jgi:hypothetical protein